MATAARRRRGAVPDRRDVAVRTARSGSPVAQRNGRRRYPCWSSASVPVFRVFRPGCVLARSPWACAVAVSPWNGGTPEREALPATPASACRERSATRPGDGTGDDPGVPETGQDGDGATAERHAPRRLRCPPLRRSAGYMFPNVRKMAGAAGRKMPPRSSRCPAPRLACPVRSRQRRRQPRPRVRSAERRRHGSSRPSGPLPAASPRPPSGQRTPGFTCGSSSPCHSGDTFRVQFILERCR